MSLLGQDTFIGSASTALTAHTATPSGGTWTNNADAGTNALTLDGSGNIVNGGSAGQVYFSVVEPLTKQDRASLTLHKVGSTGGDFLGLAGHVLVGVNTFLYLVYFPATNLLTLGRNLAGSFTTLGTYSVPDSFASDHKISLEVLYNAINAYLDDVQVITAARGSLQYGTNSYSAIYANGTSVTGHSFLFETAAIPAVNTDPLIVCVGNSLTLGSGQTPYPTQLAALLPGSDTVDNFGVNGDTFDLMAARQPPTIDVLLESSRSLNVCVGWEITNTICDGATEAQTKLDAIAYYQAARAAGWQVVALTCLPRTASIPGGFEATRTDFNAWLMANTPTMWDAIADVGSAPGIGTIADVSGANYIGDGIHLSTAGYAIVAPIVKAAIDSLTPTPPAGGSRFYAVAIRFIDVATGQETGLVNLGEVEVT